MRHSLILPLCILIPVLAEGGQRDSQQDLQQIQQDLRAVQQQVSRIMDLLVQEQNAQKSTCSADLRQVRGGEQYTVAASQSVTVPINLLSIVSQPRAFCLPTEIRVTASYLGANDSLICSGVIDQTAMQGALSQNVNLLVRPWNAREFVLWLNEPPSATRFAKRLVCITPDGLNELEVETQEGIAAVRVQVTALPHGGGLSTVEIRFNKPGVAVR